MPRLEHLWFGGAAALLVGGVAGAWAAREAGRLDLLDVAMGVAGVGLALSCLPLALVLVMNASAALKGPPPDDPPQQGDRQA